MDTRLKIQQLLIKTKGRLSKLSLTAACLNCVVGHLTRLDPYLNVVYFKQAVGQTKMLSLSGAPTENIVQNAALLNVF